MKKSIQFYFCAFNARPDAGLLLKRDDDEHNASDHYDRSNHARPPVTKVRRWVTGTTTRRPFGPRDVSRRLPAFRRLHLQLLLANRHPAPLYVIYSFLRNFLGLGFCPGIGVDVLQCFPANCLYGGRIRLQVAV